MAHQIIRVNPRNQSISPFNSILDSVFDVENVFDDVLNEIASTMDLSQFKSPQACFKFPVCNVSVDKEDDTIVLEFALAGYKEDELKIAVKDDKVVISAEVKRGEAKPMNVIHQGIKAKDFSIEYPIGSKYDGSLANAQYEDGLLTVTIPVAENKKPQTIKIGKASKK